MEFAIKVETERPHVRLAARVVNHSRGITGMLLGLAFLAGATLAQAQQSRDLNAASTYSPDTPWMPAVIAATDPYFPDPAFNAGRLSLDHFADSNSLDQMGAVTAKLANGDMVVAGLVPDGASGGYCGDGTKLCSIGLVRYSQTGQRRAWTNPGSNGRYTDQYVVYPQPGFNKFQYIRDVKLRGNFIDVMVDEPDVNHTALTLGHRNVRIVTFLDDGSFFGQWGIFGVPANSAVGDNEDFYGAQMVQISSTRMIAVATAYDSIGPYIAVTRLAILGNGAIGLDSSWGTSYGGGDGFNRIIRYYAPTAYCGASSCDATAGFVAQPEGPLVQAAVYIGASIHIGGNNWDPIVLKISPLSGNEITSFNSTGWSRVKFDDAQSNLNDRVAGLYVYGDEVYMAAQVSRACQDGIGLAKLVGATGADDTSFGVGGKVVYGGEGPGTGGLCNTFGSTKHVPFAISATGGRIGIAGYTRYKESAIGGTYQFDPMLAVVNAVNGSLLSLGSYPVKRPDGSRYGDAVLYGIYGGPNPTSPFTVSGNGRDASTGNTLSYVAGKLIPLSADRIFANNFGYGDDH